MANLLAYRDIPENSTVTVNLTKLAHGILVQNNTNVFVFINNDRGVLLLNVPPGLTLGWNEPDGVYSPQVGCTGLYQGSGRVYFYDDALDLSNNPAAQQPPGLVTIGSGTVTVESGTVIVQGTTAVSDTTTQSRLLTLMQSIGTTRTLLTSNNNAIATAAMAAPIRGFTVQPIAVRRNGLLGIQTAGPGVNNNTLLDGVYLRGVPKLPYDFDDIVPIGFDIVVAFTGDGDFSVSF